MNRQERFIPPQGKEQVSVQAASQNHGFRIPFTSFYIIRGDGYLWSRMMIASDRERLARKELERVEHADLQYRQAQKNIEMDELTRGKRRRLTWHK